MRSIKSSINTIRRHPALISDVFLGKNWQEVENTANILDEKEVLDYIANLKNTEDSSVLALSDPSRPLHLNKLCHVEDFQNPEMMGILSELHKLNSHGLIHRKDWEWAMGVLAMRRFGKLNKKSTALGVGSGTEVVPFYLANVIDHVYATDLYEDQEGWKTAAPRDFPENPKKYAPPFDYRESALSVLRMNGTKLEFPSESFDIVFSFSSIEHFGGKHHSGALASLREMQRVLKPKGIAIVATEYMINDKTHYEFFNKKTIYSDLIDKVDMLQLVEPLDLRMTAKTLDTVLDFFTVDVKWNKLSEEFKRDHPLILLRVRNILFTSVMLVFSKS